MATVKAWDNEHHMRQNRTYVNDRDANEFAEMMRLMGYRVEMTKVEG